ncbi:MAG: ParB/RepB/Spo0J family partition protein [Bacilli bacterium]
MQEKEEILNIDVDDILPNKFQPRLTFNKQELEELANSIKVHGIIEPLIVRVINGKYELIAGERRLRASKMLGLNTVPVIIKSLDDKNAAQVALLENIQRSNLSPIEEARAYKNIIDNGYLTQEELSINLGKSQPSISNKIRLLKLDEEVQQALLKRIISERHARSLLPLKWDKQKVILQEILTKKLTVKETENLIMNKYGVEKEIIKKEVIKVNNENAKAPLFDSSTFVQTPLDNSFSTPNNLDNPPFLGEIQNLSESKIINAPSLDMLEPMNVLKENNLVQNVDPIIAYENNEIGSNVITPEPVDLSGEKPVASTPFVFPYMPKSELNSTTKDRIDTTNLVVEGSNSILNEKQPDEIKLETIDDQLEMVDSVDSVEESSDEGNSLLVMENVEKIKTLVEQLKDSGVSIRMEEFDFETMYQLIIKFDK